MVFASEVEPNTIWPNPETSSKPITGTQKIIEMTTLARNSDAKHYSKWLMCPKSGFSLPEPEPNLFSFNSPHAIVMLTLSPVSFLLLPRCHLLAISLVHVGTSSHPSFSTLPKTCMTKVHWVTRRLTLIMLFYAAFLKRPRALIQYMGPFMRLQGLGLYRS